MDTNHVILACLKALASGANADEKIAVLEAMMSGNRYATESEIKILHGDAEKPKKKKAK